MSKFTAFIIPFNADGTYSEDEIEITDDIDQGSIGQVTQSIDNDQFNVGVLTYNDFDLKLRNEHGKYSPAGNYGTIFQYKRNDAIFRLYWQIESYPPICGLAVAGLAKLSEPKLIYEGLIKDESTQEGLKDQFTNLKVLSLESILSRIEVPNGELSNGQTIEDAIFAILNQALITDIITVDQANFSLGYSTTIDDVSSLAQKTGKEALDELLLISNSILYIKDRVLYIKGRDQSNAVAYNFYGPASLGGLENMQDISNIKTGVGKVFNYWTWQDENFNVSDATSIAIHGVRKKEVGSKSITNNTKQQDILGALANEFGPAKRTVSVRTPLNYDTLPLYFLDKVTIDYPAVYIAAPLKEIPVYDVSKYDEAVYPIPTQFLSISPDQQWKIMGVNILTKEQILELELREV